ncbi:MAG TPA: hypothetical protein VFN66_06195 [Burkholderiales bacterium]|nr:hypothetical protein [Burkholderiales bacterium]
MTIRPFDTGTEASLRRAIELAPEDAANYEQLALLLEISGRRNEAERCRRQAVSLDAGSQQLRLNLADHLAGSHKEEDLAEAKAIYLDVLNILPSHYAAWNNLGKLLFETGYTSAAQTAYSAAIAYCPEDPKLHANLAQVMLYREEPDAAERHFFDALALDPALPEAHQGLACLFYRKNDEKKARYHRDKGYGSKPVVTSAWHGHHKPLTLLILCSAMEGNLPWRLLADQNQFQITVASVEYLDRTHELDLAGYNLIFNVIGDADLCMAGLETANNLAARASAPVINMPAAVMRTGRLENSLRLSRLPGVKTPRMTTISRTELRSGLAMQKLTGNGLGFPFLIRTTGFHGGHHFARIESPDELQEIAQSLPGDSLLAMEWLDSGNEDGLFRKYRVMAIDGALYPLHMAVSAQWKVHYFSSDMEVNVSYREQEQAFLEDFAAAVGEKALSGLERIAQTLELDYCGIDFGLDKSGRVLLYEANATMAIVPPSHEQHWDYKRASIEKALAAVKNMLAKRITRQAGHMQTERLFTDPFD